MKELFMSFLLNPSVIGTVVCVIVVLVLSIVKAQSERAKTIVHFALQAFLEAEKLIPDNTGPVWLQKTDKALKAFTSLYRGAFGYDMPAGVLDAVKKLWTAWAAQQKGLVTAVKL